MLSEIWLLCLTYRTVSSALATESEFNAFADGDLCIWQAQSSDMMQDAEE